MIVPDDMLSHDYDQWFDNCYIYIDGVLCRYRFFEDGYVYGEDAHCREKYCSPEYVEFFWPQCGCVNLNRMAIYVERRQQRQWRRAYNSREVTVKLVDLWEISKATGTLPRDPSPFDVADAVHNPNYYGVNVAMSMLDAGTMHSVAISPHVILAGKEHRRVYLRTELVGTIEGGRLNPCASLNKARRVLKTLGGSYGI